MPGPLQRLMLLVPNQPYRQAPSGGLHQGTTMASKTLEQIVRAAVVITIVIASQDIGIADTHGR